MTARLTRDEELDIARRIVALEDQVRGELEAVAACAATLGRRRRPGRTRAGAVEALREALTAALALSEQADSDTDTDTGLDLDDMTRIARASRAWAESEALRWRLALSASRVAEHEARRVGTAILPLADLRQEARAGCYQAAIRFDPDRGLRFTTYARWWAMASISRACDAARPVKCSNGAIEQLRNLRKWLRDRDDGPAPTVAETAAALGCDVKRAGEIVALAGLRTTAIALPREKGDPEDNQETSTDPVDDRPDPEELAIAAARIRRLDRLVDGLPDRDRRVIVLRFGLRGAAPRSLREIGDSLQLSRERVRQIERDALETLRSQFDQPVAAK